MHFVCPHIQLYFLTSALHFSTERAKRKTRDSDVAKMKVDLLHWNFTSHQFNAVDWCLAIQHGGTGRSAAPAEFMGGKGLRMKISLVLSLY